MIALVVTIVVLLILAGVTINAVFSDSGIIKKAQEAQDKANESVQKDMNSINELSEFLNSMTEEKKNKIIKFKIKYNLGQYAGKTIEYQADEGMTWKEWIESENCPTNISAVGSIIKERSHADYLKSSNGEFTNTAEVILENYEYYFPSCLTKGTLIEVEEEEEEEDENGNKKKKRRKKRIEDLTYDDNLVVWNFDEGKFDTAKPLWLMKEHKTICYNLLKFSDGSELKTIEQHRIFNKELGKFTYPMTEETPIGTTTFNINGEEVKLISKEVITEPVEYYNLISYYHMNVFAEGILTSCRFNNLYEIKDMKFVKEERSLVSRDEYKEIPDEYYYGLRLAEQPKEINRGNDDKHANSIESHIKNVYIATAKPRE